MDMLKSLVENRNLGVNVTIHNGIASCYGDMYWQGISKGYHADGIVSLENFLKWNGFKSVQPMSTANTLNASAPLDWDPEMVSVLTPGHNYLYIRDGFAYVNGFRFHAKGGPAANIEVYTSIGLPAAKRLSIGSHWLFCEFDTSHGNYQTECVGIPYRAIPFPD